MKVIETKEIIDNCLLDYSEDKINELLKGKQFLQNLTEISSISSRLLTRLKDKKLFVIFYQQLMKLHINIKYLLECSDLLSVIGQKEYLNEDIIFSNGYLKEAADDNKLISICSNIGINCCINILSIWSVKVTDYQVFSIQKRLISALSSHQPYVVDFLIKLIKLDIYILNFLSMQGDYDIKRFISKLFNNGPSKDSNLMSIKVIPPFVTEEQNGDKQELIEENTVVNEVKTTVVNELKEDKEKVENKDMKCTKIILDDDNNEENRAEVEIVDV